MPQKKGKKKVQLIAYRRKWEEIGTFLLCSLATSGLQETTGASVTRVPNNVLRLRRDFGITLTIRGNSDRVYTGQRAGTSGA